jgi:hypothetical protein
LHFVFYPDLPEVIGRGTSGYGLFLGARQSSIRNLHSGWDSNPLPPVVGATKYPLPTPPAKAEKWARFHISGAEQKYWPGNKRLQNIKLMSCC